MPDSFTFGSRLKHAWNAFLNRDPTQTFPDYGPSYSIRPDRVRLTPGNEKSIVSSIITRIAIDVAGTTIQHVRLDQNGRFLEVIHSGLNECLSVRANKDQTGQAFIQDIVMSLCDEGSVAIVPVDTTLNPRVTGSYDIESMRTAKILQWYPDHVRVRLYNDRLGKEEDIILPKSITGIVENPFYAVMNEPNSTLRRLTHKLNLLDAIDDQSGSGKLDLIIKLPYLIKGESRIKQAEQRRKQLEDQLAGSKYGVAYVDGTEQITQLNRSVENNLMKQIEFLTSMLYSQLGITQSVLDGTAKTEELTNYYSRTIAPIVSAIVNEINTKFLTKTARSQHQAIYYFQDPFKFVPVDKLSEMADKFTRNEIMSSNEIRQIIGMKASDDPRADQLLNKNIASPEEMAEMPNEDSTEVYPEQSEASPSVTADDVKQMIDEVFQNGG